MGKHLLWAAAGTVFGVLGALGAGMIWYLVHNLEFMDFLMHRPSMLAHLFWFGVPMLWCGVAIAGAVSLAKWFRSQGCGYRRRAWVVLLLIFAVQGSAGFALEQSKVGEHVDQVLEQKMHWYRGVNRMHGWLEEHPEAGFLMGTVVEVRDDTLFILSTRGQKIWEVEHTAELPRKGKLEVAMDVRVVGAPIDEMRFRALRIRPVRGGPLPPRGDRAKMRPQKGERSQRMGGDDRRNERRQKVDRRPELREY